jgi:hypothetical protein
MNPTLFRRAGAVTLVTATVAALAGCGDGIGGQLTFNDVTKAKVSQILLDGSSGDVQVTTAAVTETTITRIVHSNTDPAVSYSLTGTQLHLDSSCGSRCEVSYQIEVPAGVSVSGRLGSGDVRLDGVSGADVEVSSGDIAIRNATGPVKARASSGDVTVSGSSGPATLVAASGDVRVLDAGGPVSVKASSGDVHIQLKVPASVTATVSSGDLAVQVPQGAYKVHTTVGSGNLHLNGVVNDDAAKNVLNLAASSGALTLTRLPPTA